MQKSKGFFSHDPKEKLKRKRDPFPRLSSLVKNYFVGGILVATPFAITIWLVAGFLQWIWSLYDWLPDSLQAEALADSPVAIALIEAGFTAAILVLLILGISTLGWISKQVLGQQFLNWISLLIQRIPVIRGIYSALDQLFKTFSSGKSSQFSRVVYVEYPRKESWALAFVTGPVTLPNAPKKHLNLYIPTTPNPTSGFHLIVPESQVVDSGLTVEEAFRTIISLGIVQPEGHSQKSNPPSGSGVPPNKTASPES